jgi:serine/threonine-protein kinase
LIDGENLRETIDRMGSLSTDEAVRVLVDVASALEVAAEAGITHRDIKPENIMRSARGAIKVADFGLARLGGGDIDGNHADLTQAGLTLGTPRYMSPEQIQGQSVDSRSDLYSLGVSMYHLLAGRPPFEADDPLALAVMHLHETAKPIDRVRDKRDADGNPDVPEWLVAVIGRLMKKSPDDRFQSPSELLDAVRNETSVSTLNGIGGGMSAATTRLQRATEEAKQIRRRKRTRIATAIALPILTAGAAFAYAHSQPSKSLAGLLRPGNVAKASTVQEQYFIAIHRNDEAGWLAVGSHFSPDENSNNAGFHAKAMLQLARLMADQEQTARVDEILLSLLADSTVDRVYQVLALVHRCSLLESKGEDNELARAREQLESLVSDLIASNPAALDLVERVVPETERIHWSTGSVGS